MFLTHTPVYIYLPTPLHSFSGFLFHNLLLYQIKHSTFFDENICKMPLLYQLNLLYYFHLYFHHDIFEDFFLHLLILLPTINLIYKFISFSSVIPKVSPIVFITFSLSSLLSKDPSF